MLEASIRPPGPSGSAPMRHRLAGLPSCVTDAPRRKAYSLVTGATDDNPNVSAAAEV